MVSSSQSISPRDSRCRRILSTRASTRSGVAGNDASKRARISSSMLRRLRIAAYLIFRKRSSGTRSSEVPSITASLSANVARGSESAETTGRADRKRSHCPNENGREMVLGPCGYFGQSNRSPGDDALGRTRWLADLELQETPLMLGSQTNPMNGQALRCACAALRNRNDGPARRRSWRQLGLPEKTKRAETGQHHPRSRHRATRCRHTSPRVTLVLLRALKILGLVPVRQDQLARAATRTARTRRRRSLW